MRKHQLGEVFSEKALVCLTRNDYEPDIVFYSAKKAKGFTNETMEFPAPDFVVEVLTETTKNRDRGVKFEDYAAHGVSEYWIVDCDEQTLEQNVLRPGEKTYHLAAKQSNGEIRSAMIDGFSIPVQAVFDDQANAKALAAILI